jgi:hypothetical protein
MSAKRSEKQWEWGSTHYDIAELEMFGTMHTRSMWRTMMQVLDTPEETPKAESLNG